MLNVLQNLQIHKESVLRTVYKSLDPSTKYKLRFRKSIIIRTRFLVWLLFSPSLSISRDFTKLSN